MKTLTKEEWKEWKALNRLQYLAGRQINKRLLEKIVKGKRGWRSDNAYRSICLNEDIQFDLHTAVWGYRKAARKAAIDIMIRALFLYYRAGGGRHHSAGVRCPDAVRPR